MDTLDASQLVSYLEFQHTADYFRIAAVALSLYEYTLTLPAEHALLKRHPTLASVLFLANRYALLLENALLLVSMVIWAGPDSALANRVSVCAVISRLAIACGLMIILSLTIFASMRVYVLWDRSLQILMPVLTLGLVKPAVALYLATTVPLPAHSPYPTRSCLVYANVPAVGHMLDPSLHTILYWLSSTTYFAFEAAVLVLTWCKTLPALRILRGTHLTLSHSLFYVMSRDGTSQFAVLLAVNIVSFLSYVWQPLYFPLILTDTIVSIATARFILNLQSTFNREECTTGVEEGEGVRFDGADAGRRGRGVSSGSVSSGSVSSGLRLESEDVSAGGSGGDW